MWGGEMCVFYKGVNNKQTTNTTTTSVTQVLSHTGAPSRTAG